MMSSVVEDHARSLVGHSALVTGGASGIGLTVALQLAAAGASVTLGDVNSDALSDAKEYLRAAGHLVDTVAVDVTDRPDVANAVDEILARFGRLDVLIHSAGVGLERAFLKTTDAEWDRILRIDLTGTFITCQVVANAMAKRKYGRILTLASTAALRGGIGRAAYGAAKGGVIALTQVMAIELAPIGITVNALAPGAIETPLVKQMHSPETREAYTTRIPMGRYGTTSEVAHAAVFLADPRSSYITGHVLGVDGGFLAAGVLHSPTS